MRCVSPGFLRTSLTRLKKSKAGNIAIISAVVAPVVVLFCGLIVDEAALNLQRRHLQNAADMAAISGATNLSSAETVVKATLKDNGLSLATTVDRYEELDLPDLEVKGASLFIEKGRYTPDAGKTPAQRFRTDQLPYNAVRVTVREKGTLHFTRASRQAPYIERTAIASASPTVSYSLGSRLASLEGGIANQLLSALTGSSISLNVMDYRALVDVDVSLLSFLDALASEANITAVTYEDVLQAQVKPGDLAGALSRITDNQSATVLNRLKSSVSGSSQKLRLDRIIDLGPISDFHLGTGRQIDARIGIMELLGVGLLVAGGEHQVALDLSLDLPGLAALSLDLAVGEPARHSGWFTIGENGTVLRTAQTRARLEASIGADILPSGSLISLPVYLDLAYAEAAVSDLTCANNQPSSRSATVMTKPAVARLWLGSVSDSAFSDFSRAMQPGEAVVIDGRLVEVTASAQAEIGNNAATALRFSSTDIDQGTVKTVQTTQYTQSLTGVLLDTLDVDVNALGLSLSLPSGLDAAVSDALSELTPTLDTVLHSTLNTLGLSLGEADVQVHSVDCSFARLVL